ncbi:hypothetical protein BDQ17DRAFT_1547118 [Cyathus striatus]|nr:hypothetical protein BDQ17DRAFT_1547118 [Cyathus striatus]
MDLADAAEKYMVYIAMPACRMRMLYIVQGLKSAYASNSSEVPSDKDNIITIVEFAVEHSYMDIVDEVAPLLMMMEPKLESTIFLLPVDRQAYWALYWEQWLGVHREACSALLTHKTSCKLDACKSHPQAFEMKHMMKLDHFISRFNVRPHTGLREWKGKVNADILAITKFSSICDKYREEPEDSDEETSEA